MEKIKELDINSPNWIIKAWLDKGYTIVYIQVKKVG